MVTRTFRSWFDKTAHSYSFNYMIGGWFRASDECILVLDLHKSHTGNNFILNIKIFVQGVWGNKYSISNDLSRTTKSDIFLAPPDSYLQIFDLSNMMPDKDRKSGIERLFKLFIDPMSQKSLTKAGLISLDKDKVITIDKMLKDEFVRITVSPL